MNAKKTISTILAETLDLGNSLDPFSSEQGSVSASKLLLEERKKLNRPIETSDFIAFTATKKPLEVTPYLEQISACTVDDPKYWKNGSGASKPSEKTNLNTGRTKQNKLNKIKKSKGENYKDKFTTKLVNKSKKSQLSKHLKSL